MNNSVTDNKDQSKIQLITKKNEILGDLDKAVEQVKLHKEGKIELRTIQEMLEQL